jgi:hypothetical protein
MNYSDIHDRHGPNPQDDRQHDVGKDESEIDRILADSFPASDAPPWTVARGARSNRSICCIQIWMSCHRGQTPPGVVLLIGESDAFSMYGEYSEWNEPARRADRRKNPGILISAMR